VILGPRFERALAEVSFTLDGDGLFLRAGDEVDELSPRGPWDLPEIASRAPARLAEDCGVDFSGAVSIDTSRRAERRSEHAARAEGR
jgi:hypothetical protein